MTEKQPASFSSVLVSSNQSLSLDDLILEGLNPEQRLAASQPATVGVKVLAGAGTGKTQLISRRFPYLVRQLKKEGVPRAADRILVLTFTDKAAASMKQKINESLQCHENEMLGPESWVSTFHTFANRLLRNHAYWLGRTRDFELLDTLNQQVVFLRILKDIREGCYENIEAVLAEEGLKEIAPDLLAISHLQRLQAEAGLDSLDDLLKVSNIMGLVSHVKSSGKSPKQFYDDSIVQLDRLTQAIIDLPCEYDPEAKQDEQASRHVFNWHSHLKNWYEGTWTPLVAGAEKAKEIMEPFEFLRKVYLTGGNTKNKYEPVYVDPEPFRQQQAMAVLCLKVVTAVYALYQQTLRQKNLCDFDDLMILTIQLLEENPTLRQQYQEQFKHIIVDEFQDSNGSQLQLLKLLLDDTHTNLTVVGDVKQSIYGFRFAQPENMDLVFETPEGTRPHQTISLPTNYRSTQAILKTANIITEAITGDDRQFLYPAEETQCVVGSVNPEVEWLTLGRLGEPDEKGRQKEVPIAEQHDKEKRFMAQENSRIGE